MINLILVLNLLHYYFKLKKNVLTIKNVKNECSNLDLQNNKWNKRNC